MHLNDYPHYYVKNGERVAVYFTGEARDLRQSGWVREKPEALKKEAPAKKEVITEKVEVVIDEPETDGEVDFEFMTKPELLAYAMQRGVDLPNNALKADLVEACKKL